MADLLLEIEQARSAVINAAAAIDTGERLARERALSAAKFSIGRIGALVAQESIQMHGGIGMTWELPLPHYAKRLVMIDHQLGDEDHHLQRYIALGKEEGAVRILTNSNPAARNAITPTLYAELSAALADAEKDPEVGAIVFTGAGDIFCSGGDLNLLAKRRELPMAERRQILEGLNNLIRALRDCGKPVIAAVEGGAAGAGRSAGWFRLGGLAQRAFAHARAGLQNEIGGPHVSGGVARCGQENQAPGARA
eukprot:gene54586-74795_t